MSYNLQALVGFIIRGGGENITRVNSAQEGNKEPEEDSAAEQRRLSQSAESGLVLAIKKPEPFQIHVYYNSSCSEYASCQTHDTALC